MNTSRSRRLAVLAAAPAILLAGCAQVVVAGGPTTSQDRDIASATAVVLETSGDLSVSQGEPALTLSAPRDALERLTSDVDGDALVLGVEPGTAFSLGAVKYELTLPELRSITVDGSGDVKATVSTDGTVRIEVHGSGDVDWSGLDAGHVEVIVAGSGDVALSGEAEHISVEVDGSGNVRGSDLRAQHADVVVRGSGDVDVSPAVSLSADILGSGGVTYSGDPTLKTEITGSGDVVRR